jgi:flagellar biosynthesis protein FlhF
MTTRVFRGRSLLDARRAATAALGEDAVVLTSREVRRSGIFGLLGGTEVEIAAARVPTHEPIKLPSRGPFAASAYLTEPRIPAAPMDHVSKASVVNALRADLRSEMRAVKLALSRPPADQKSQVADLAADVSALRDVLDRFVVPPARGKVANLLRARGIEGPTAAALTRALKVDSGAPIEERLRIELGKMIHVSPWALPTNGQRVVVAAVGPSGVGKTTTLAKLATLARVSGRSVAFVTCDTFRVGGVDHVRRYATLLDVPFETARSAEELETFLGRTKADVVIVDTSGQEPSADAAELLLAERVFAESEACSPFERRVLLCVPGACRGVDAARIARAFAVASPTLLAVTKLDETTQPSGIVHAAHAARLPIALTCAGQRVPEDLDPGDLQYLLDQLVPSANARKDRAA